MSRNQEGFGLHPPWERRTLLQRLFASFVLASLLSLVTVSAAWAQPPREDPGTPPVNPGDQEAGWQVMRIPNLPANALLGDVWVAPNGDVYVWASFPSAIVRPIGEDTPEGERLPGDGRVSNARSSTLYKFDGLTWSAVLSLPGQTGAALYGSGSSDVWASTNDALGESRLYHFDGTTWNTLPLAGYYVGRLHTLAGKPGDLYLRIDRVVLHDDGRGIMMPVYEQPGGTDAVRGLVYLECGCLLVMRTDGMVLKHGNEWIEMPAGFSFADIRDAWGTRDEHGALQLYALGSNAQDNGIRMWRYAETDPVMHTGTWGGVDATVVADPPGAGVPGAGSGFHEWGVTHNDVYAAGVVAGEGHLLRYDGMNWTQLVPPEPVASVHGVWGTQHGTVWFSVNDGRMVRYQRANRAPDLTNVVPVPAMLWPATGNLVPIDIAGVTDPDGDVFTLKVTGITQDEAPLREGWGTTCPDGVITPNQVYLRAEHAENGDGRIYDVEFVVTDRLGSESRAHVRVCAPHSGQGPCDLTTPTPYNSLGPCDAIALDPGEALAARDMGGVLQVKYALPQAGHVHLGLYDLAGRLAGTVQEGEQGAGTHEVTWNTGAVRPGIYFLKLRGGDVAFTRRVVLLR